MCVTRQGLVLAQTAVDKLRAGRKKNARDSPVKALWFIEGTDDGCFGFIGSSTSSGCLSSSFR
jgi:hypothetical protein